MLILLTRPPKILFPGCGAYYLKSLARKILQKTRGPEGVLLSLKRGLDELKVPYKINTQPKTGDIVNVLSNISALRYAIEQKQKGKISQLIAGPNLVVMPDEHNKILASAEIDKILTVSPWVKDLYNQVLPEITPKLHIWPAGVQVPKVYKVSAIPETGIQPTEKIRASQDRSSCIVFKKNVSVSVFEKVIQTLNSKSIPYTVFEYGNFKQPEYFAALEKNDFMIYLQEFESQGIALQEAWVRNVPTLVWNKGFYTSPRGHIVTGNVAAPFLSEQSGALFSELDLENENFAAQLDSFIAKMKSDSPFTPRQYSIEHLSDKASAEIYMDIINKKP